MLKFNSFMTIRSRQALLLFSGGGCVLNFAAILLLVVAQTQAASSSEALAPLATDVVAAPVASSRAPAETIVIPKDTPVHLMTLTEVTTKTDTAGTRFKLRVNEDVVIDGSAVIPKGTLAWGEVTSAESSGNLGKSGRLTARLLFIELNGQRIPIEGDTSAKGKSGTAETVVGVLGLGLLGLFAKGNNAKIKAGEKSTAFVANDFSLKLAAK